MKSLLTRLTESIGDEIARNSNNNIFEKLSINKNTKLRKNIPLKGIDLENFIKDLKEENPELADKVDDYIQNSKKFQNNIKKSKPNPKPTTRSSSSIRSYGGGCGSGSNSSSCGSSRSSRSSSCGGSSSYSDYSCGRSGRSSGC